MSIETEMRDAAGKRAGFGGLCDPGSLAKP
jgi:hypothetical protein